MVARTPAVEPADARPLTVRPGFHLPQEVIDYVADSSVHALTSTGPTYREACRSLSELTRLVGEVLRRARPRFKPVAAKSAAPTATPAPTPPSASGPRP